MWKKSMITIASLFAVAMFIGASMSSVVASDTTDSEEECIICNSNFGAIDGDSDPCENCLQSIDRAVETSLATAAVKLSVWEEANEAYNEDTGKSYRPGMFAELIHIGVSSIMAGFNMVEFKEPESFVKLFLSNYLFLTSYAPFPGAGIGARAINSAIRAFWQRMISRCFELKDDDNDGNIDSFEEIVVNQVTEKKAVSASPSAVTQKAPSLVSSSVTQRTASKSGASSITSSSSTSKVVSKTTTSSVKSSTSSKSVSTSSASSVASSTISSSSKVSRVALLR